MPVATLLLPRGPQTPACQHLGLIQDGNIHKEKENKKRHFQSDGSPKARCLSWDKAKDHEKTQDGVSLCVRRPQSTFPKNSVSFNTDTC